MGQQSRLHLQVEAITSRLLLNGFGALFFLMCFYVGFQDTGKAIYGIWFDIWMGMQIILSVARLVLWYFRNQLTEKEITTLFNDLMTTSSVLWIIPSWELLLMKNVYGVYTETHHLMVKIQIFFLIGIINANPQFFRHQMKPFLINTTILSLGVAPIILLYFESLVSALGAAATIATFFFIVLPQYLRSWEFEFNKVQAEQELQTILNTVPGSILELKEGTYTRVNSYATEHLCYQVSPLSQSLIGQTLKEAHGDQDWISKVTQFSTSSQKHELIETPVCTQDGPRMHLIALANIGIQGSKHTVVTMINIEEQYQARKQAEAQSRLAGLGLMAAGIAHEINNPLAVIKSRVELATKGISKEGNPSLDKPLEHLARVIPMIQRITRIIKTMKNLARDSSEDAFESVKVSELIDDVLLISSESFNGQQIPIRIELDDSIRNLQVDCRGSEISQVLLNSISNSIQAVQSLEQKWVRISGQILESELLIQIQDSGAGIPEEHRHKIMTPLFTTKAPGEGTGLGLALCLDILRAHNGDLYFDHNQNHTTLVMKLPIKQKIPLIGKKAG